MINLSKNTIDRLARIYAVSNTPAYLFKHFRKDPEIQSLAKKSSPDELISLIQQTECKEKLSLTDVVKVYIATVALT